MTPFYSLRELSARTGISMPTLRRWCTDEQIPGAFLTAGAWFVPSDAKLPEIKLSGKRSPIYGKNRKVKA